MAMVVAGGSCLELTVQVGWLDLGHPALSLNLSNKLGELPQHHRYHTGYYYYYYYYNDDDDDDDDEDDNVRNDYDGS